jgi:hypothetical protein
MAYFVPIRYQTWLPFINGSELNEQSLQRTFQGCFLPSFDPFGQAVSEEMIFLEINQSETFVSGTVIRRSIIVYPADA